MGSREELRTLFQDFELDKKTNEKIMSRISDKELDSIAKSYRAAGYSHRKFMKRATTQKYDPDPHKELHSVRKARLQQKLAAKKSLQSS